MHGSTALVGELLAYADSTSCAWTSAFDLSQLSIPPGILSDEQLRMVDASHRQVVAVFDRPLVFDSRVDRTHREQGYLFPYKVSTLARQRTFDLRRTETLDWLMTALNEDFPNALFLPGIDPADPDSEMRYVKNAASPEKRQQIVDTVPGPIHHGLRGIGEEMRGLHDLLQYLLMDALGGTPMTDLISAYVLDRGADCIIYPSARVDCGVTYHDGDVDSWWGWNVVDLDTATSAYSGHLALVSCPAAKYMGTQMTVFVDPVDGQDPYPEKVAALRGWAAEGLAHHTTSMLHARRWITNFASDGGTRFPALEVERTARKGRLDRYPRKPRSYDSALSLRIDLINQDVRLESAVLREAGHPLVEPRRLGDYVAMLCRDYAFLGSAPVPTVYCGSWFLLQSRELTSFTLLCPCCGIHAHFDRELDFVRMAWCQRCRYGAVLGEDPQQAGARAFEAVDEGLTMLENQ